MSNLPNDPMTAISATSTPNADLPAAEFPSEQRIATIDLVGPVAANRQHAANEKRTETLRDRINKLIAGFNVFDTWFLRRDGTAQKDTLAGMQGDLPMNGHKVKGIPASGATGDAVEHDELTAALALKANLASPVLTGDPKAPTPSPGDNDTSIATTAFVTQAVNGISPIHVWKSADDVTLTAAGQTTGGTSLTTLRIVTADLRYASTNRLLSGLRIEIVSGGGAIDFDSSAQYGFVLRLTDGSLTPLAADAYVPLGRWRVLNASSNPLAPGSFALGDAIDADPSSALRIFMNAASTSGGAAGAYPGWFYLQTEGLHQTLATANQGAVKLQVLFQGSAGNGTNWPTCLVHTFY